MIVKYLILIALDIRMNYKITKFHKFREGISIQLYTLYLDQKVLNVNAFQVTIYHILKLFQSPPGTTPPVVSSDFKKPLVSEFYEELIFQDPSAMMRQLLTNTRQLTLGEYTHDTDCEFWAKTMLIGVLLLSMFYSRLIVYTYFLKYH